MNRLLVLLLLGFAMVVLLVPFSSYGGDLERVSLYRSGGRVLLKGDSGQLELPFAEAESSLFELLDPSNVQRVELVPYGGRVGCNVLDGSGKRVSLEPGECLTLALRLERPVYVDRSLLKKPSLEEPAELGL